MARKWTFRVFGSVAAALSVILAMAACTSVPPVQTERISSNVDPKNKRYHVDENGVRVFKSSIAEIAELERLSVAGWPNNAIGIISQSSLSAEQKEEVISAITTVVFGIAQCAPPYQVLKVEKLDADSGQINEIWITDTCGRIRWNLRVEDGRVQIQMLGN